MVGRSWPKDRSLALWLLLLPVVVRLPWLHTGLVLWTQWLTGHFPEGWWLSRAVEVGLPAVAWVAAAAPSVWLVARYWLGGAVGRSPWRPYTLILDRAGTVLHDAPGRDLSGADLSGADLRGADLRGRDLRGCNLSGAVLRDADLTGCELTGADLSAADLTNVVLTLEQRTVAKLPPPGVASDHYRVCPVDDMPQVLIPAGEFLMGSPDGQGDSDEHPQKRVFVSAFWLDLHPVTVAQYRRFCQATGRQMDSRNTDDQHPVVYVSWDDATAYAQWAGRELPTEAQWEKAARGGTTTVYPWGDTWDPARANGFAGGPHATTPVGSYPPNAFGLYDLIGNVWEWCRDWFDSGWYARMPDRDPVNQTGATYRVLRGGSWYFDPDALRAALRLRLDPDYRNDNFGFRCSAAR